MEKRARRGFYAFHDVSLPGLGNVDHVVLGQRGLFCVETKSHEGRVTAERGLLLVNGRPPEKDLVRQTCGVGAAGCARSWAQTCRHSCSLRTDAFVQGRLTVRGCASCRSRGWSRRFWAPHNTMTAWRCLPRLTP